jgi:iron(III) transport system permease protein
MWRWRIVVIVILLAVVGVPLVLPFIDLATNPVAWSAWRDVPRITVLAGTTAALVGGVLLIDMPLGTAFAILLYRSDIPGRGFLRKVVVVSLFVPLPLLTCAWQSALAGSGWLGPPNPSWPWATGLRAAVWVHAAAGLPWVIWLVGQGLCWVEPQAEDDALLAAGPGTVLWRVTLVRARGAILAAATWVALLTAHEITVTDLTQVRTLAEEVYTQFALPDAIAGLTPEAAVARAVAVTLPGTLLVAMVLAAAVWHWERAVPPLGAAPGPRPLIHLDRATSPILVLVVAMIVIFALVPIGSLIWTLGATGRPEHWSASVAAGFLAVARQNHSRLIAGSLAAATAAGLTAATLAFVACWSARDSRTVRLVLTLVVAFAWATAGPVVGAGLKTTIDGLVEVDARLTNGDVVRRFLYDGPSPLPVIWADILRFFPCAVALIWPAVRLVPESLTDSCRVDGGVPTAELRHAVLPLTAPAFGRAAVAVGVLSLGELSASKIVATPGDQLFGETFAHIVWARMHYGVNSQLAALCLLLLAIAIPPTVLLICFRPRHKPADETL